MKRTPFLTLALCLITFFATAQATGVEICNNGIDDDGDGFIDCYDGSCANVGTCDGTFLGNDAKCQAQPAQFPKFTMTLDFASPNETTNHLARTALGDLDRDGIPEIVTMNRYTKKLYVLNGNNGSIKYSLSAPFEPQWEVAIANIDNDACGEIFTFGNGRKKQQYILPVRIHLRPLDATLEDKDQR
ncbi:MAG: VCBS repeat-containing protein [Bacteroidota bacterium]